MELRQFPAKPDEKDNYELELNKTFQIIEDIENLESVSPMDIQEFKGGFSVTDNDTLTASGSGLELSKSKLQDWKTVFLQHWLYLQHMTKSQKKVKVKVLKKKLILRLIRRKIFIFVV